MPQVSRAALEQNEEQRNIFQAYIGENFHADQLVFVNESACNQNTVRQSMAWSPIGSCARHCDFFVHGTR